MANLGHIKKIAYVILNIFARNNNYYNYISQVIIIYYYVHIISVQHILKPCVPFTWEKGHMIKSSVQHSIVVIDLPLI